MNHLNLLPKSRIAAKRRAASIRRWVIINSICAAVLLVASIGMLATQPEAVAMTRQGAGISDATLANFNKLSNDVSLATARLESLRDLSTTPDWGRLLATLSQLTGDDVVLDAVNCRVVVGHGDTQPRGVRVAGIGRSQQAVAELVLRLESLKFFHTVTLAQTTPRTIAGGDAVGFEIVCTLPGPAVNGGAK